MEEVRLMAARLSGHTRAAAAGTRDDFSAGPRRSVQRLFSIDKGRAPLRT